jgi:hypothetical protein
MVLYKIEKHKRLDATHLSLWLVNDDVMTIRDVLQGLVVVTSAVIELQKNLARYELLDYVKEETTLLNELQT